MRHSLRLRLLVILIAVPVVALVSVAIAARISSDSTLDGRLQFQIQPLRRAGGGPTGTDENNEIPVFTTQLDIDSSRGVTFTDPATGDEYAIQAEPGFIEAYERDRDETVSAINRQVTIAAIAVTAVALAVAVWLSSRIVRPVEQLTNAARRLEDGDLSQRVDVSSQDEIGDLGHAFNAMAASIEQNQDLRRQMTSDVAHELRTPLNNISGYLDAIADGVVEPNPATIASLQEEAALLVRLVADLEQLSLADAGRQVLVKQRLNLADVVERAVAFVTPRARARGITIHTLCSATPSVEGDGDRLAQVVRNLLENAVTHTPESGSITVTLRPEGRSARLAVADTGLGIAAQHLPLIFERFYRADPSRTRATGGVGLGLAIVKQLVDAHGGTVSAENVPGSGACFTVTLPLAPPLPTAFGVPSGQPLARPS
jgi:two-component system sensor histidine kinase BaeS